MILSENWSQASIMEYIVKNSVFKSIKVFMKIEEVRKMSCINIFNPIFL